MIMSLQRLCMRWNRSMGFRVERSMKPMSRLGSIFGVLATLALALTQASPAQSSSDALLQRMIAQTGHMHSYTAAVHADIAMHTFPYLNPSLDGTYYHKEPDKNK